jgi:hypothetical protein
MEGRRMRKWPTIGLLVLGATLGATVFSGSIATAAQSVSATITGPLDGGGNVKVHEQGTANVNVVGNASVQAGIPMTQFSVLAASRANTVLLGPEPARTSYALTSLAVDNNQDESVRVHFSGEYGTTSNGDCTAFQFPGLNQDSPGPVVTVPPHDTVSMEFPQPFVIEAKEGQDSCLDAFIGGLNIGTSTGSITVVGYRF